VLGQRRAGLLIAAAGAGRLYLELQR
jgi:hypothetical protein